MKKNYKILGFLLFVTFFLASASLAFAQETGYKLLEPIPGYIENGPGESGADINAFIPNVIRLAIAVAGVLAVLVIIYGGVQYITTDAFEGKSEAKKTIENAIWGLLLAISAFIILNTINPDLVSFNLKVTQFTPQKFDTQAAGEINMEPHGKEVGTAWGDDTSTRNDLTNWTIDKVKMFSINRDSNCTAIGQTNPPCTSVYHLNPLIISKLKEFTMGCADYSKSNGGSTKDCTLTITGGTEYWMHGNRNTDMNINNTKHKPVENGGSALDISIASPFIKNFFYTTSATEATRRAKGIETVKENVCVYGDQYKNKRFKYKGVTFVLEGGVSNEGISGVSNSVPLHWHLCF